MVWFILRVSVCSTGCLLKKFLSFFELFLCVVACLLSENESGNCYFVGFSGDGVGDE